MLLSSGERESDTFHLVLFASLLTPTGEFVSLPLKVEGQAYFFPPGPVHADVVSVTARLSSDVLCWRWMVLADVDTVFREMGDLFSASRYSFLLQRILIKHV